MRSMESIDTSRAENSAAARWNACGPVGSTQCCWTARLPGGLDPHLVPMADDIGVPVILMSGHPDMMDRVPGVPRPCIQKPFSLTALLATIESVIAADEVGAPRKAASARPVSWLQRRDQRAGREWLGQEFLTGRRPLHPADEQHLEFRMQPPRLGGERDPVEARHRDVGDDHRYVRMPVQHLQPFLTVRAPIDVIAEILQHLGHGFADQRVIIDHQTNC